MNRFILYALRWQLSTPILALCIVYLPYDNITKTILANFIGAVVFFNVDKHIFRR